MSTDTARRGTVAAKILVVRGDRVRSRSDAVVTEEPMEIRAAGPGQEEVRVAVTMRTPGHDFELAAGFLVTEGLVERDSFAAIAYCEEVDVQEYNVVTVRTRSPFALGVPERNFFAYSACGVCGKAALEAVQVRCGPLTSAATMARGTLLALPDAMQGSQRLFDRTGGIHAAGLFTASGELLVVREDVGRHNAVDKVVGALVLGTAGEGGGVLLVSGRVSFEIVQKAAVARIPIVCAVSAPSSLALQVADALGMTLVGFLRPGGFNVYTHPERVRL